MSNKAITSADSLNAVETMVNMIEENEWAEHVGVCPLTRRLETGITKLHNEIAQKNKECEKYEHDNYQAVEFLGGQSDGLANLCNIYRDEIWRLRDGINTLLNQHRPEAFDTATEQTMGALRDLATSNIESCPPLPGQTIIGMDLRGKLKNTTRHASVWDALIDDQEEREDLKERSRLLRLLSNHTKATWPDYTVAALVDTVGFSRTIWEGIQQGHIDEFTVDSLTEIATLLGVNTSVDQEGPQKMDSLIKNTVEYICSRVGRSPDEKLIAELGNQLATDIARAEFAGISRHELSLMYKGKTTMTYGQLQELRQSLIRTPRGGKAPVEV